MFYPNPGYQSKLYRSFVIFLFVFLSVTTFHKNVFAGIQTSDVEDYRHQGYEAQQRGNLEEALSLYSKALVGNPHPANILNDIGVIYEQLGLEEKAEEKYLEAIQTDSSYLPPYMNLAYFYERQQNLVKAIEFFQTRIELGEPEDPWTKKAEEELGRIKEKIPFLKKKMLREESERLETELIQKANEEMARKKEVADTHYAAGQQWIKKGNTQQALNEYQQALNFFPNDPIYLKAKTTAHVEIAKAQIRISSEAAIKNLDAGDIQSARKEISRMLAIIPKDSNPKTK